VFDSKQGVENYKLILSKKIMILSKRYSQLEVNFKILIFIHHDKTKI